MLVDVNHWRAAIASFRFPISTKQNILHGLQLMKRFSVLFLHSCTRCTLKSLAFRYTNFYATCLICHMLHLQRTTYLTILRSGDIETNPGPGHSTFNFCSWNLNSIFAHDFTRVSLIEAYNAVYNYDLIGIVETHLDSTVDVSRLNLTGYSFFKSNHPNNVKRGGVGLYVKDSLPAKKPTRPGDPP